MHQRRRRAALVALAAICSFLAACNTLPAEKHAEGEAPVITGTPSRRNTTPLEPAFACLANAMRARNAPVLSIAVGDVKDYTGKYSQNEGNTITQGGALMIYSALGKMGGAVQLQERFDTRIAELELAYTDKRQLGDGRQHAVEAGKPPVPWMPYYGGSILRSAYYIVGGITEVNYSIASSGAELTVDGIGIKRRTFTMNIGVDLRIVDTKTLVVAHTVSLQKQVIGEEVGAGIYRFFGDRLVDLNAGAKNQEPLQLGVRTAIEHGVLELVASVAGVDLSQCVDARGMPTPTHAGEVLPPPAAAVPAKAAPAVPAKPAAMPESAPAAAPVNEGTRPPENMTGATGGVMRTVPFEFGSANVTAEAASMLEHIAAEAQQNRKVTIHVLARDNETWPPAQRRELTNQRMQAITDFLASKGVAPQRVGVSWLPAPTDSAITRDRPGFQLVATLVVAP
jgi:curli biogenesis system outer membrane secretion channel CsgG